MAKKLRSFRFDEEKVVNPLLKAVKKSKGRIKDLTHAFELAALDFIEKNK